MTLALGLILRNAGIDPVDALVIRHAYAREHEESDAQSPGGLRPLAGQLVAVIEGRGSVS